MPRSQTSSRARVALVGRPNVGKSTIFNRLTGTRRAIVTAVPGTTRDVLARPVEWRQRIFTLVDTGGVVGASEDPMWEAVGQSRAASSRSGRPGGLRRGRARGPGPGRRRVARELRVRGVPVVLAINKMDDHRARDRVLEFHRFGFEPIVEIAAEHGQGIGDLLDEVVARLPAAPVASASTAEEPETAVEPQIAVVGRPNVGKSSLVNRLLREDRVLVSSTPGTTRDAVDEVVRWHRRQFCIVDTAGIRRPGRVAQSGKVEAVSVVRARHAMEKSDVAVLVVDATAGVGRRDASIAGEAVAAGCGVVVAANKWDLVPDRTADFAEQFDDRLRDELKFADYAPILHLSALTGERTERLLGLVDEVDAARRRQVATGELNRVIRRAVQAQSPSGVGRGSVQIRYAVQTGVAPPIFTLFTSRGARLHFPTSGSSRTACGRPLDSGEPRSG